MLFNDFNFLFAFLPAVLIAVLVLCPSQWRCEALIVASLLFYGFSGREHAAVLVGCVVWVYVIVDRLGDPKGNKKLGWLAVLGPLGALGYFKYSGFVVNDLLFLGGQGTGGSFDLFSNIVLPAGISFFTFQLVAYAIDRFRGTIERPVGFRNLLLYISFFPQLVAGPIVRLHQVERSLKGLSKFRPSADDIYSAIVYVTAGLAFKVLVADSIGHFLQPLIDKPAGLGIAGLSSVVFSYTFQIYFDFYGYSLCAIGLGRLFGFHLPDNFLRPYSTLNPREFWRCWHVTLSNFIRDYIYIALGGNDRYIRNILIVFLACGLWHGAGYSFLLWGAFHFALVAGYKQIARHWDRMPKAIQWFLNFSLVSVGWLFFIYPVADFGRAVSSIFTVGVGALPSADLLLMILISAFICFGFRIEAFAHRMAEFGRLRMIGAAAGCALVMAFVLLFIDRSQTFIYFRF